MSDSTTSHIRPRERDAILQSLRAGVVPRVGQQHIQVGRINELNVMVTDIVLPGTLDGFALAHLACSLLPRLAIIYTTGFGPVARVRAPGAVFGDILEKPYKADVLITRVRAACGSRAASTST